MIKSWCDTTDNICLELLEEALNQGFFEEEAYIFVDKIFYYSDYRMIRDALDWGLCLEELLNWLILRSLFAISEETVTKNMAERGFDFTLTGFDILTKDVELYEEIVSPYVNRGVLDAIAKDLDIKITDKGLKEIKTFEIPVRWLMMGSVEVKAASVEEATELVKKDRNPKGGCFQIPEDGAYVQGTFKLLRHSDGLNKLFD